MVSNILFMINVLEYAILVLFKRCKIVLETTNE